MFTIIFGIAEILEEKENHTFQRILISPIHKISILMGNLISTFVIGFIQVSLMFIISKYLFKVDFKGSMIDLLIVISAFVFCVTAFGLFLANYIKTIGQLSAITPIILTGTAMLGGCFWPLEIVSSKALLLLANITPQKWAMLSIEKIVVYGYGLNEVKFGVIVLLFMGIVYLFLGTILLNKETSMT